MEEYHTFQRPVRVTVAGTYCSRCEVCVWVACVSILGGLFAALQAASPVRGSFDREIEWLAVFLTLIKVTLSAAVRLNEVAGLFPHAVSFQTFDHCPPVCLRRVMDAIFHTVPGGNFKSSACGGPRGKSDVCNANAGKIHRPLG